MFLFAAGATPFMMGIAWASIYPSDDPHVIGPLVVGCVMIGVFALWETYGDVKHPLTPTYIFTASKGRQFTAPCVALSILNMSYYGTSIIWPQMIVEFYSDPTDWKRAALLSLPQGLGISLGGVLLGIFGSKIRHWQHQQTVAVFIMVLFGGLMGLGNPGNLGMMIAFLMLNLVGTGYGIYLCIAVCQMGVEQEQLGTSGGLDGCVRFAGGTSQYSFRAYSCIIGNQLMGNLVAEAVYLAIFKQQIAKYENLYIPAAAEAAGLPSDQVGTLLGLVGTDKLETTYDTAIVKAVQGAVQRVYERGIQ
jgi:hypothetical protein